MKVVYSLNVLVVILVFLFFQLETGQGILQYNYNDPGRVVGGSNAEPNQFPYIISLRWNGSHICGGSILNRYWILTAAHCVYRVDGIKKRASMKKLIDAGSVTYFYSPPARELSVSAGSYLLSEPGHLYPVAMYVIHEDYDRFDITNDVAVVLLKEPLIFSWFVHAIQISTVELVGNTPCVLAGWGRKIHSNPEPSNHLQFVALRTLLHAECRRLLAEFPIQVTQVCTLTRAGEGACTGDSGGPLVTTDNKLIGMVSYGRPCAKGYPDVFTRVSSFIHWINKHINSK